MDATYFKRFCLLCYQDHEDCYTQLIRFSNGEHFEEIKEDLNNLIKLGVTLKVLPPMATKVFSRPSENHYRMH